ncbi:MAG TPA: hypothetical protein VIZ28_09135 [Chitinophagaceae bacterium]
MKKAFLLPVIFSFIQSFGQTGSEIYLFDIKVKNGQVILSGGVNITNHKGYDNQPFFHPSKPIIYYSSFNDSGRSDIKYYDYKTKTTTNLTLTNEREYSPTVTPGGKFISCIIQRDNGAQDLGKYPINGGEPEVLINNLTVGYHAWASKDKLVLFVLGDSNRHTLRYYDLLAKKDTIIATNIGRSLHKIPGQQAMSFVQKISDTVSVIKRLDLASLAVSSLVETVKGSDHLVWLKNNTILMSSGNQVFYYQLNREAPWQQVVVEGDISMPKGVTRLAVNVDNNKLAVVVSE